MRQKVTTIDNALQVYREPDLASSPIAQVSKGIELQLGAATVHEGREWMEATLEDGRAGYVLGPNARSHTTLVGAMISPLDDALSPLDDALMAIVAEERNPSKVRRDSRHRDNIVIGGLLCAIGLFVIVVIYLNAPKGGATYYGFAWGAIVYGGVRLIRGLARW
jgi:hypothetical protein